MRGPCYQHSQGPFPCCEMSLLVNLERLWPAAMSVGFAVAAVPIVTVAMVARVR